MSGWSGDWVRTHNKQSATLYLAERKMESGRREAQRERERAFFADVTRRVRSWFRR